MAYSNTHATDLEKSSSQSWSITNGAQTGLAITGDLTFYMRVKLESDAASDGTYAFIAKRTNATGRGPYLFQYRNLTSPGRIISFFHRNQSDQTDSITQAWSPSVGTYYNVSLRISGTALTFWVDGSNIGGGTLSNTRQNDTGAPFAIGADAEMSGSFFDGLANDVRIWSRALSDSDMASLHSDPCNFDNGTNLEGWWFINDTLDAGKATDNSANNNDLTNNNSATFSTDVPYTCSVPSSIKTIDGLAKASVKTVDALAIASVKTWNGLA